MYWTYDELGLLTGTSETQVPDSTAIPYPGDNGYYQFIDGDWVLIFGVDANGNTTITPTDVVALPSKPVAVFTIDGYPALSSDALASLFVVAEAKVKAAKLFTELGGEDLWHNYVIYRKGDASYLAVGLGWSIPDGRMFNAKVTAGEISDVYEIFRDGDYCWKELDPVTFEPVALYTEGGNKKLDPVTLEVLQVNSLTDGLNGVPADFTAELVARGFPFTDQIWHHSIKPYGEIVAFYPPLESSE